MINEGVNKLLHEKKVVKFFFFALIHFSPAIIVYFFIALLSLTAEFIIELIVLSFLFWAPIALSFLAYQKAKLYKYKWFILYIAWMTIGFQVAFVFSSMGGGLSIGNNTSIWDRLSDYLLNALYQTIEGNILVIPFISAILLIEKHKFPKLFLINEST